MSKEIIRNDIARTRIAITSRQESLSRLRAAKKLRTASIAASIKNATNQTSKAGFRISKTAVIAQFDSQINQFKNEIDRYRNQIAIMRERLTRLK